MEEIVKSLETSLSNENWYGALFIALSLPDICGKIDSIHTGSRARYEAWFIQYVQSKYTVINTYRNETTIFLSGNDCYALRCAYLHEGQDDISSQRAKEAIESFHFIAPLNNMTIHNNKLDDKLQLQIDIFCTDIVNGVKQWLSEIADNDPRHNKIKSLLKIQFPDPDGSISI